MTCWNAAASASGKVAEQGVLFVMQGRVTDHRIGITEHNLDAVLTGERLSIFIESLLEYYRAKMLQQLS